MYTYTLHTQDIPCPVRGPKRVQKRGNYMKVSLLKHKSVYFNPFVGTLGTFRIPPKEGYLGPSSTPYMERVWIHVEKGKGIYPL